MKTHMQGNAITNKIQIWKYRHKPLNTPHQKLTTQAQETLVSKGKRGKNKTMKIKGQI